MFDFMQAWSSKLLAVLRLVTGLVFLQHGTVKLLQFPVDPAKAPKPIPALTDIHWTAGAMEIVGGLLIIFGLFTRPVAFLLSGEMAIAYWLSHAKRAPYPVLNGGDVAIMFCFVFLYLAAAGGGDWSVDELLGRARRRRQSTT